MKKGKLTLVFMICLSLALLLASCGGKKDESYLKLESLEGVGSNDAPYTLSVKQGDGAEVSIDTNCDTSLIKVSCDSDLVNITPDGKSLKIEALKAGSATAEISIDGKDLKVILTVTVSAPPLTLDTALFTDGCGSEADPFVITVGVGSSLSIPYVSADGKTPVTEILSGETVTTSSADSSISVEALSIGVTLIKVSLESEVYYVKAIGEDRSYAISGKVVNSGDDSKVYADVNVKLVNGDTILFSKTDENGVFWFTNLTPGRYTLTATVNSTESESVSVQSKDFVSATEKLVEINIPVDVKD